MKLTSLSAIGFVSVTGSSPVENVNHTQSEASVKKIANMKEQIENYQAIISKQEQLLQVNTSDAISSCVVLAVDMQAFLGINYHKCGLLHP